MSLELKKKKKKRNFLQKENCIFFSNFFLPDFLTLLQLDVLFYNPSITHNCNNYKTTILNTFKYTTMHFQKETNEKLK